MTLIDAADRVQQIQSTLVRLFEPPRRAEAVADPFAASLAATRAELAAPVSPTMSANPAGATGAGVVAAATKYLGVPYVLGGTDSSGIDCSGLVQRVFSDLGVEVPRLVSGQMTVGEEVPSLAQARPGDLIVLHGGDHIAIYAGDNKIIHAPYEGRTVSLQERYFSESEVVTIRRIVPAGTGSAAGTTAASAGPMFDLAAMAQAAAVRGGL